MNILNPDTETFYSVEHETALPMNYDFTSQTLLGIYFLLDERTSTIKRTTYSIMAAIEETGGFTSFCIFAVGFMLHPI